MASRRDIEAGRAFVRLYVKNEDFLRGIKEGRRLLGDLATSLENVGRRMMAISIASLTPIALSIREWGRFDDVMREVKSVTETTVPRMYELGEIAKKAGEELGYTAVSVGELMAELGRADVAADDLDKVTVAVLNLARATKTDASRAGTIMNQTLNQFGLGADRAVDVADMLTVTANKSLSTVESLGDAMHYVGTVAKDFALPTVGDQALIDVLALVGGLHNIGLHGELAGTSLRRMYTLIAAGAPEMKTLLGVDFTKGRGLRGLADSLGELNDKLSGLSIPERAKKLHEAFGILGITGASGIGKMTESLAELEEAIRNSAGVSADQAAFMNAGIGGAFRRFWSALGRTGIELGMVFNNEVADAIGHIRVFMAQARDFIKANKELIILATKWGLGIGIAGAVLVGVGVSLGIVKFAISGLASVFVASGIFAGMFTRSLGRVGVGAGLMGSMVRNTMLAMDRAISSTMTRTSRTITSLLAGPIPQFGVVLRAAAGRAATAISSAFSVLQREFVRVMPIIRYGLVTLRTDLVGLGASLGVFANAIVVAFGGALNTISNWRAGVVLAFQSFATGLLGVSRASRMFGAHVAGALALIAGPLYRLGASIAAPFIAEFTRMTAEARRATIRIRAFLGWIASNMAADMAYIRERLAFLGPTLTRLAPVAKAAFAVISSSGRLAANVVRVSWMLLGPPLAAVIRTSLSAAFAVVQAVGVRTANIIAGAMYRMTRGAVRGVGRGISGGAMGIASIVSTVGMGAGGVLGQISGAALGLMLIGPSLLGLLNPAVLLTATIAGGIYAWMRYSESGKNALKAITEFMKPLVTIAKDMVNGIKMAFEADDLKLAGMIAITGLKAILLVGMATIVNSIGGMWGNTIGKIISQLSSGDLTAAMGTAVQGMTALWGIWSEGVVKTFTAAAKSITNIWYDMVNSIANKILELAAKGGIVGKALGMVLGVDVEAEVARAKSMGASDKDITDAWASSIKSSTDPNRKAMDDYLTELDRQAVAAAEKGVGDLGPSVGGGRSDASKAADAARAELATLIAEAKAKAEAAKVATAIEEKKREAVALKEAGDTGTGGALAGAGGSSLVTFSAIEAKYGPGSSANERIAELASKQLVAIEGIREDIRASRGSTELANSLMRGFITSMTVVS